MTRVVEAIYEDGFLKPQQPLPLRNREKVRITVESLDREPHSVLDIPPIHLGSVLSPLSAGNDLLGEMLEGRR